MATLFHVSAWAALAALSVGDTFTLRPGPQGAEGRGVYFSVDRPVSVSTAEGCRGRGPVAVVQIEAPAAAGWWRSKPAIARKFGRPVTWHSDGKPIRCWVRGVVPGPIPTLLCAWAFDQEVSHEDPHLAS